MTRRSSWIGVGVGEFALQIVADGTDLQKKIVGDMLQGVIVSSPVDQGVYRSNHRLSINSPDNTFDENQKTNDAFQRASGAISSIKLGNLVYIQNNAPYGIRLENGHSQQAPLGIYSVTFASVKEKYGL